MPRVLMALLFFPRGGSSHVTANLAHALPGAGWDVTLVTGSVRIPGRPGDAEQFFAGLDIRPVDMTAALAAPDPLAADPPLHPSYEDRPGEQDRVMASLDDDEYEHQVAAWARALEAAGAADADVLHLHHLTPIHAAAEQVAPGVPIVGHLHGTELLMLEEIAAGAVGGPHAEAWVARMRAWAGACARIVLLSQTQVARAEQLLGIDPERCICIPNGFDPTTFRPIELDRLAHWRKHLVDDPKGWAPGAEPGSVAYDSDDLEAFAGDAPVLLYVGRFTAVKRLTLLIEAHHAAGIEAPLVLCGGFPGEWEGEHPLQTVERLGARNVFQAGWHGHAALPEFLAASDVVVLPSVREQFGQVLVEGMACGLPAVAVDAFGPSEIVRAGETGWLVPPDDGPALAAALAEAATDPAERRRRGAAGREDALARYAWPSLAARVAEVYRAAARR
jgi:glycosyltransferase involved in cell wall biosynthesis